MFLGWFGIDNDSVNTAFNVLVLVLVVLWVALIFWTYADARRRIEDPMLVGCATLASVFPFVGTIVYAIVRPPEFLDESRERELELAVLERELRSSIVLCPNCRNLVEKEFLICPVCNWDLKKPCINCERPLNMEWEICPYCTTDQRSGKKIGW